ncbi:MAG: DUF4403 family protein [Mesorhizobium sp.]|nr:MAG: DUF4403 family protein [Mesorhizobium sp.]
MTSYRTLILTGVAALAIGTGLWWYLAGTTQAAPPRSEMDTSNKVKESSIVLPVTASLADLQTKLNSEVPTELFTINEGRDACVPAKWAKICVLPRPWPLKGCAQWLKTKSSPEIDCHLDGWVRRGNITVSGSGANAILSVPLSLSVTAKGRGEIGKNIQETATGSATVTATVTADIDESWNPVATVEPSYRWDNPIGVDILGFRITFADKVDPEIKKALDGLKGKLPGMLSSLDLKRKISKIWDQGFAPIQVNKSPDVWLRFAPTSIGYDGYNIADGSVKLSLLAGGQVETFAGGKPPDPAKTSLPPLLKKLPPPGFEFNLPVSLDYSLISAEAEKALKIGQVQELDVKDFGKVKTTFTDVDIYQTDGKLLAIGVSVIADPPSSIFDTTGTVWFTTDIAFDNNSKRVLVKKLDIYRNVDNSAVDLLLGVATIDLVNKALRDAVSVDFSKEYAQALKEASEAIRRQVTDEMYVIGTLNSLEADKVAAGSKSILVNLLAKGTAEAGFGKLPE